MNIPNARERILKAAAKVFAGKGYEGSRIDEIAKVAGVPKSLIYYHFKSKEDILQVLTDDFIAEYKAILSEVKDGSLDKKKDGLKSRMKSVYYEFGMRNADLVRVLLIESLKKSNRQPVLYRMVDAITAREAELGTASLYDIQERRVVEFFTNLIPNFAFICFSESWPEYYGTGKEQFEQLYIDTYQDTHGAYHENHK